MKPAAVAALKMRLEELGFNMVFDVGDQPTNWLRHALREFQIYARFSTVAQEKSENVTGKRWLDRLKPVVNDDRYVGPVDGVLSAEVQKCLDYWATKKFRCPVVTEIYVNRGQPVWLSLDGDADAIHGNYWRYDDPRIVRFVDHADKTDRDPLGKLQIRICDLSGLFEARHGTDPRQLVKSGRIRQHGEWRGGFTADSRTMSSTGEVLPDLLIGKAWKDITSDAVKSSFRVARVVAERECLGYFQSVNGYDDAWISLGPCHWTLAIGNSKTKLPPSTEAAEGELPAFLAYWTGQDPAGASEKLTETFALTPTPAWPAGKAGTVAGSWGARNYTGRLRWQSGPIDGTASTGNITRVEDLDWFRTTHWFWRFLALSRNVETFRRRQWDMIRLRMRDILAYELDPSDRPGATVGTKRVPVSVLFTSEASVALLLRCHIRKAGFLSHTKFQHPSLRLALAFAGISEPDPRKWSNPEETLLIEGMMAAAALAGLAPGQKKALKGMAVKDLPKEREKLATSAEAGSLFADCKQMLDWPEPQKFKWGASKAGQSTAFALAEDVATPRLKKTRNSFTLDTSDLPPLPKKS
ncbi:hypothetical protein J5288_14920 [Agrobacterium sp. S2/73]|uniref:hypothetical protein n=1 Tax=unclassified Agrobacterium TaxID=2632611 RepID=UPI001ADA64FA|nr:MULTISPECIES: hypothetical protein [unclassified Agrobacterium]MBO9110008.1 hypothetical protein [Agrobacterium sp. S2/73]QXZ73967.1 hypothetical protein J5276_15260 [Agrobacterium sp. S7/73]